MKKTAIEFALYLHNHPEKGLDQWHLMRALPEGMLALLQAASSKSNRAVLAETANLNEAELKQALINFIELVLEGHEHSAYRGLAAREKTHLDRCLLHKKLLLNIFHPDKMPLGKYPYITQQIQDSYEQVKTDQAIPLYYASEPNNLSESNLEDPFGSVKVNNAPRPSSAYRRHQQKNHVNYVLLSGVIGLLIVGIMIVLIVPSTPQSIVRQASTIDQTHDQEPLQVTLVGNSLSKKPTQPLTETFTSSPLRNGSRVQLLINELETALEGDLMNELQARGTPSQSSKQLNDLFTSADQKKVFLHELSWKKIANGFYGEGRFMSRFQFIDREQWLTRSGKFFITLTENNSKLHIKQFHFEDNLH